MHDKQIFIGTWQVDVRGNPYLYWNKKNEEGHPCQSLQLGCASLEAVKFLSIKNGFRKAGITSGTDDDASQTSNISDDKQITSTPILDPVLDAQLMDLFNSDTEDEDFNGFWTELTYHSSFNTCPSFLLTNQHGAEQSLAQNVATNSHSVKYEMLRFGYGPPVFLLYNFINKV